MALINKLDNFTLIIPTKDRPEFLARSLQYYSFKNKDLNVVIVDSSLNSKNTNRKLVKRFQPNKKYIYAPGASPDKAVFLGLLSCNTKYSSTIADDDILLIDKVETCINELQKNSALIAVYGHYIQFGIFPYKNKYTHGKLRAVKLISTRSFLESTKEKRLRKYYNSPLRDPLVFSIGKTSTQLKIFRETSSLAFSQRHVIPEILHTISMLKLGPVKNINKTIVIRQSHPNNAYHLNDIREWLALPDHFLALKKIEKNIKVNKAILDNILKELNSYLISKLKTKNLFSLKDILRFLKPLVPQFSVPSLNYKKLELENEIVNYFDFIQKPPKKMESTQF